MRLFELQKLLSKTVFYISGSPIGTSGSSVNINIEGKLDLDREEIIKIINEALKKHI